MTASLAPRRKAAPLSSADWQWTPASAAPAAPRRRSRRARSDDHWLWTIDVSLAGVLVLVPFLMGGRHPLGRGVLLAFSAVALAATLGRMAFRVSNRAVLPGPLAIFAAGAGLLVAQVVPLSSAWIDTLSPAISRLLPLWSGGEAEALGVWTTLSLAPAATFDALPLWLAYAALFWVTAQRVERPADAARLLRCLGLSSVAMAAFGLLQYVAGNGDFFWCYEHPYTDADRFVKGAFTNRNHFAHWMALGAGPLAAWWLASLEPRETNEWGASPRRVPVAWLLAGALALVVAAALLSLSRGGALAVTAAAAVLLGIAWRAGRLRGSSAAGLLGVSVLLLAVVVATQGSSRVASRLGDLASGSAEDLDRLGARRAIWAANLQGIRSFPLFGTGVGSHREVYPIFLQGFGDYEFTHAENGYLQIGLETGAVGLTLLAVAALALARLAWKAARGPLENRLVVAGLLSVMAASAVHSLVDFVWYVPAAAAATVVMAACLWRLAQGPAERANQSCQPQASSPRWAFALAATIAAAAGLVAATRQLGPAWSQRAWESYLLLARNESSSEPLPDATGEPLDAAARAARASELERAEADAAQRAVALLETCVRYAPLDARAHLRLASAYLRRFELAQKQSANSMGVMELRDAAAAARFADAAAVAAWLHRACGPAWRDLLAAREHALLGLRGSPLAGEGYTTLAQLTFLDPAAKPARAALLDQAARVRPHDGGVLFQLGRESLLAGRPRQAMEHWRKAYSAGQKHRRRVIDLLAVRMPARVLLAEFETDLAVLRVLRHRYEQAQRRGDLIALAPRFAEAAAQETPPLAPVEAAQVWVEAHRLFRAIDNPARALEASRRAVERDPHGIGPRMALADDLLAVRQFDSAAEAYRWCRARRPHDERLARGLEAALRGGRR